MKEMSDADRQSNKNIEMEIKNIKEILKDSITASWFPFLHQLKNLLNDILLDISVVLKWTILLDNTALKSEVPFTSSTIWIIVKPIPYNSII